MWFLCRRPSALPPLSPAAARRKHAAQQVRTHIDEEGGEGGAKDGEGQGAGDGGAVEAQ